MSKLRIGFDHCYQSIESPEDYFSLGKRGFDVDLRGERVVRHPGTLECRFIGISSPDHLLGRTHYLEFFVAADKTKLRSYLRSEKLPSDTYSMFTPGFSLTVTKGLEGFFRQRKKQLARFGIYFEHRNYQWEKNSADRLPGWNFVNFRKALVRGANIWLTEYEPAAKKRKAKPLPTRHPNTCSRILGFIWRPEPALKNRLGKLVGRGFRGGKLVLDDGLFLLAPPARSPLAKLFAARKRYPFWAVVLECENFEKFLFKGKPDLRLDFEGRRAGLIRRSRSGWDILVVERKA